MEKRRFFSKNSFPQSFPLYTCNAFLTGWPKFFFQEVGNVSLNVREGRKNDISFLKRNFFCNMCSRRHRKQFCWSQQIFLDKGHKGNSLSKVMKKHGSPTKTILRQNVHMVKLKVFLTPQPKTKRYQTYTFALRGQK